MITISIPYLAAVFLITAILIAIFLEVTNSIIEYKLTKLKEKMSTEWKIEHLIRNGYKVTRLGKNIKAQKGERVLQGRVGYVHNEVFGYY